MKKVFIGIDIGKDGGIAVIDHNGKLYSTRPMPKIGDELDIHKLNEYFLGFKTYLDQEEWYEYNLHIIFENLHSIFGSSAKSNFVFGQMNMAIEALCVAYSYKYLKVNPRDWQKVCWQGINVQTTSVPKFKTDKLTGKKIESGTKDKVLTKPTSLLAAKRLFPKWDFRAELKTKKSKNDHDGMVDAALLAYYGYLKFK